MGAGSSSAQANHVHIIGVLRRAPFMQMMDDKILNEIAGCFQLVTYGKGAVIKNDPCLFFIVADGAVDISSLVPTSHAKQQLHEVLCQRRVGDYISFAAREQLLGRLLEDNLGRAKSVSGGAKRVARKNLTAMLDLNRITADMFTGCTLLKLQRDRFLKLRSRLESRRSQPDATGAVSHTRRFSDEESSHTAVKPNIQRDNTAMTRPEKMNLLSSIVESDIVNYLLDIPFLESVEQSRLVTLSNLCSYMFIRKGATLCQEGEIGDKFFICIRGTLRATVQTVQRHVDADGLSTSAGSGGAGGSNTGGAAAVRASSRRLPVDRKIQSLKKMGPGAYFGEISLLFKIPRICSITAVEDSLLVYIDRVAFCNFLKIVPEANLVLLEHVRLNFLDTLIKQGCAFLNAVPQMKLQELSYRGEIVEHATGESVLAHGDGQTAFYIVLRGEVEVEYFGLQPPPTVLEPLSTTDRDTVDVTPLTPHKEVIRVRPGGYFGQEAIILGVASPVSATCIDHSLTLRLSPTLFEDFFSLAPALYAEFCIKCLREKARSEHVMQHYEAHNLWAADCVNRRRQHELTLFESIEDFTWEVDLSDDNIHELALNVYLHFLADSAPQRVRIPSTILDRIEDDLSSQRVDRAIFDATRNEILTRMEDDHFEAFKKGALFQEFLGTLYCPRTIYDGLTAKQISRLGMGQTLRDKRDEVRARMLLEDVDESDDEVETKYKSVTTTASARPLSGRSLGRGASQKRYLVANGESLSATAPNTARRKSRMDTSRGLQRNVSTSFVF